MILSYKKREGSPLEFVTPEYVIRREKKSFGGIFNWFRSDKRRNGGDLSTEISKSMTSVSSTSSQSVNTILSTHSFSFVKHNFRRKSRHRSRRIPVDEEDSDFRHEPQKPQQDENETRKESGTLTKFSKRLGFLKSKYNLQSCESLAFNLAEGSIRKACVENDQKHSSNQEDRNQLQHPLISVNHQNEINERNEEVSSPITPNPEKCKGRKRLPGKKVHPILLSTSQFNSPNCSESNERTRVNSNFNEIKNKPQLHLKAEISPSSRIIQSSNGANTKIHLKNSSIANTKPTRPYNLNRYQELQNKTSTKDEANLKISCVQIHGEPPQQPHCSKKVFNNITSTPITRSSVENDQYLLNTAALLLQDSVKFSTPKKRRAPPPPVFTKTLNPRERLDENTTAIAQRHRRCQSDTSACDRIRPKFHVRGKRKAPNPPVIVSKEIVIEEEDSIGDMRGKYDLSVTPNVVVVQETKISPKPWYKRSSSKSPSKKHVHKPITNLPNITNLDKEAARIVEENHRRSAENSYNQTAKDLITMFNANFTPDPLTPLSTVETQVSIPCSATVNLFNTHEKEEKKKLAIVQPQKSKPKETTTTQQPNPTNNSYRSFLFDNGNGDGEWACPRCTLNNPNWRSICDVCFYRKNGLIQHLPPAFVKHNLSNTTSTAQPSNSNSSTSSYVTNKTEDTNPSDAIGETNRQEQSVTLNRQESNYTSPGGVSSNNTHAHVQNNGLPIAVNGQVSNRFPSIVKEWRTNSHLQNKNNTIVSNDTFNNNNDTKDNNSIGKNNISKKLNETPTYENFLSQLPNKENHINENKLQGMKLLDEGDGELNIKALREARLAFFSKNPPIENKESESIPNNLNPIVEVKEINFQPITTTEDPSDDLEVIDLFLKIYQETNPFGGGSKTGSWKPLKSTKFQPMLDVISESKVGNLDRIYEELCNSNHVLVKGGNTNRPTNTLMTESIQKLIQKQLEVIESFVIMEEEKVNNQETNNDLEAKVAECRKKGAIPKNLIQNPGDGQTTSTSLRKHSIDSKRKEHAYIVSSLLRKLDWAIARGDHRQAAKFAYELAKMEPVHLKASEPEQISIRVYVEDRLMQQGPFTVSIMESLTVGGLKSKIESDWGIPFNFQKWILGKKMAEDDSDSLVNYNLRKDSLSFLYLVTPEFDAPDVTSIKNERKISEPDISKVKPPPLDRKYSEPIPSTSKGIDSRQSKDDIASAKVKLVKPDTTSSTEKKTLQLNKKSDKEILKDNNAEKLINKTKEEALIHKSNNLTQMNIQTTNIQIENIENVNKINLKPGLRVKEINSNSFVEITTSQNLENTKMKSSSSLSNIQATSSKSVNENLNNYDNVLSLTQDKLKNKVQVKTVTEDANITTVSKLKATNENATDAVLNKLINGSHKENIEVSEFNITKSKQPSIQGMNEIIFVTEAKSIDLKAPKLINKLEHEAKVTAEESSLIQSNERDDTHKNVAETLTVTPHVEAAKLERDSNGLQVEIKSQAANISNNIDKILPRRNSCDDTRALILQQNHLSPLARRLSGTLSKQIQKFEALSNPQLEIKNGSLGRSKSNQITGSAKQENNKEGSSNSSSSYLKLLELEKSDLIYSEEEVDCPICLTRIEIGHGVILRECFHSFCQDCLIGSIEYADDAQVKCPYRDQEYSCDSIIQEREIKALVPLKTFQKLLAKSVKLAEHAISNTFHCKTADCPGWCVFEDNVNVFKCPVCSYSNCINCQAIHEGQDCHQYQRKLALAAETDENVKSSRLMLEKMIDRGEALDCPACHVVLLKKWGCDWVKCSYCKTEICWVTKGYRWGPNGKGDTSGGCKCGVNGVKCHQKCTYCH